jgi:hypothetical protein
MRGPETSESVTKSPWHHGHWSGAPHDTLICRAGFIRPRGDPSRPAGSQRKLSPRPDGPVRRRSRNPPAGPDCWRPHSMPLGFHPGPVRVVAATRTGNPLRPHDPNICSAHPPRSVRKPQSLVRLAAGKRREPCTRLDSARLRPGMDFLRREGAKPENGKLRDATARSRVSRMACLRPSQTGSAAFVAVKIPAPPPSPKSSAVAK